MLRKEAVEAGTLDLIKKMMADNRFHDFNLVGGTALALMIGHRKSIDIDLFSTKDNFTLDQMLKACHQKYPDINIPVAKNALVYFEDVQLLEPVDFIGPDVKWPDITERLKNAHANPHLSFGLPGSD